MENFYKTLKNPFIPFIIHVADRNNLGWFQIFEKINAFKSNVEDKKSTSKHPQFLIIQVSLSLDFKGSAWFTLLLMKGT